MCHIHSTAVLTQPPCTPGDAAIQGLRCRVWGVGSASEEILSRMLLTNSPFLLLFAAHALPCPPCIHPTPSTPHPLPYTQLLSLYTLQPTHPPHTLYPTLNSHHSTPYTLHPEPYTLHPTPYTLHHAPCTLHHTIFTLYLKPYARHRRTEHAAGGQGGQVLVAVQPGGVGPQEKRISLLNL